MAGRVSMALMRAPLAARESLPRVPAGPTPTCVPP
jgi:hypothetical protein